MPGPLDSIEGQEAQLGIGPIRLEALGTVGLQEELPHILPGGADDFLDYDGIILEPDGSGSRIAAALHLTGGDRPNLGASQEIRAAGTARGASQ
jgi:hypothetical protein